MGVLFNFCLMGRGTGNFTPPGWSLKGAGTCSVGDTRVCCCSPSNSFQDWARAISGNEGCSLLQSVSFFGCCFSLNSEGTVPLFPRIIALPSNPDTSLLIIHLKQNRQRKEGGSDVLCFKNNLLTLLPFTKAFVIASIYCCSLVTGNKAVYITWVCGWIMWRKSNLPVWRVGLLLRVWRSFVQISTRWRNYWGCSCWSHFPLGKFRSNDRMNVQTYL